MEQKLPLVKIYVVAHKATPHVGDSAVYPYIGVGPKSHEIGADVSDDNGDNIAAKNDSYCELTALYWIWKNDHESDISGLCHYRRFLSSSLLSVKEKHILSAKRIAKILESHDVIMPRRVHYRVPIWDKLEATPSREHMTAVREILTDYDPEALTAFDGYFKGNATSYCNMVICRKELLDEYCAWLFPLMERIEKALPAPSKAEDPYLSRLYGFISERLLCIWVAKRIPKKRIAYAPMAERELPFKARLRNVVFDFLNRILFHFKPHK